MCADADRAQSQEPLPGRVVSETGGSDIDYGLREMRTNQVTLPET